MTWSSFVLFGVLAILVVLVCDLVFSGGKWCARLAERTGLVARHVESPRDARAPSLHVVRGREPSGERTTVHRRTL